MPNRIDTVLFDLDDTLCTYRRSVGEVLEAAFADVGVAPLFAAADYYDAYDEYVADSADVEDLRRRCFGDLAVEVGCDRSTGEAVAAAYAEERDQRDVELLGGAREAIDALATDHRLGLVTNGSPEMQRAKLEGAGLAADFETIVCAGYDAPAKPAPEPFALALSALGSAPDRAVHVGNSLATDVAGARAAGLRSAWIPREDVPETADPAPDYVLESLVELASPPWR